VQKKVTLSVNDKAWSRFRDYCDENDIMVSKRIERLVGKHLNELKYKGAKDE